MKKVIAGLLVLLLCLLVLDSSLPPSMAAPVVVYGFIVNANSATWVGAESGTGGYKITFGNTASSASGFVTSFTGTLEDGLNYSNTMLVSLPSNAPSRILGQYSPMQVPAQAQLELVYGFQQGSNATDGVKVSVNYAEDKPGSSVIDLYQKTKTYNSSLGKVTIDLSAYAGQTGIFTLIFDSGSTATNDTLVLVQAALTAPQTTPTSPPSPPGPTTTFLQFHINDPTYFVNGTPQTMDTAPVIVESRTFLPIRYVAQELGATVDWYAPDQKVTISTAGGTKIELWIGRNSASVDGNPVQIDLGNPNVAPFIQPPGRTMMPLRFISENLGCKVDWLPPGEVQVTYPYKTP